ncbi:eukaryotic translation initiation factor 2D-like [Liolophura sinensis]|uniref:eukaryotic translation initiation factor 2D-like n=1 Tax=Liolophura sinensis TaxID=3198878 RepID=UPI003158F394
MFFKPFKIKSQTSIKGSDRKKLRAQIAKLYPNLTSEMLGEIIPAKEEMSIMKVYTGSGDSALVYILQKNPIFFEVFDKLYPSVYTLWKCPDILPVFATWPPVFGKLAGGADLMLPGVVVRAGDNLPSVEKAEVCAVRLVGSRAPIATGVALMSSDDMRDSGMKGKGVKICHIVGDELWSVGDKSEPPVLPDPDFDQQSDVDQDGLPEKSEEVPTVESLNLEAGDPVANGECEGAEGGVEEVEPSEEAASEPEPVTYTTADMDEFLFEAFMTALKTKVKKSDLPLLTSNLYRNLMLPCSTRKDILDVKKSTYKKLSKFLQAMSKKGLIKVKELTKGVESVTEINKSHPDFRDFTPPDLPEPDAEGSKSSGDEGFQPPCIQEMYSVTSVMLPVFRPAGYSKGSALSSTDVRAVITDYVKANDLQVQDKKSVVQIDPIIGDVVLDKGEVNTTHMTWEELLSRFLQKMPVVHQVTFPGRPPVIRKGKLEPISVNVEQRTSNKKVTLVDNLELFGIDPVEFAHRVQVSVACSASACPTAQKNKGLQVMVQGNQINFISDLLLGEYHIQRKYIKGLEKAPKSGKRR